MAATTAITAAIRESECREFPKSETPNKMMDGVVTMERCFIDQDDHPVTVSFQLLCHDWKKIEKSDKWHQVEKKILKSQSKYNQMILRDQSGK